ncbi:hypothetical protein D3C72_2336920 [compost metagenome]
MLNPRLDSLDAKAIKDWLTGSTGPSARPITARATNNTVKVWASPEEIEQSEKAITATISTDLRRF